MADVPPLAPTALLRLLFERYEAARERAFNVGEPLGVAQESQPRESQLSDLRRASEVDKSNGAACRICLTQDAESVENDLVAPCQCSGSQEWVHIACLRQWQQSIQQDNAGVGNARASQLAMVLGLRQRGENRARVCNVCLANFALSPLPQPSPVPVGLDVKRGMLFVAVPDAFSSDGGFAESVVLLCGVRPRSIHGLIINQPYSRGSVIQRSRSEHPFNGEEAISGSQPTDRRGSSFDPPEASLRDLCDTAGIVNTWCRGGPVGGGRLGVVSYSVLHGFVSKRHAEPVVDGGPVLVQTNGCGDPAALKAPELVKLFKDLTTVVQFAPLDSRGEAEGPIQCVHVFKGYCRWGRAQLAAEYGARRWGMCQLQPEDCASLLSTPSDSLWSFWRASGRLAYASVDRDAPP